MTGAPDEDEGTVEERRANSTERLNIIIIRIEMMMRLCRLLMPDVASSSCRSFTSEGTQVEIFHSIGFDSMALLLILSIISESLQ